MSTFHIDPADERPTIVGDLNSGIVVILDEGDWCPRCGAPNADEDGHDPSCPLGLALTEEN